MESITGGSRRPDIVFHRSGRIDITARLSRMLGLCRGDVVDVAEDGDDCFVYVRWHSPTGRHKGMAYPSNRRGYHFRAYSVTLCTAMLERCRTEGDTVRLGALPDMIRTERYGRMVRLATRNPL